MLLGTSWDGHFTGGIGSPCRSSGRRIDEGAVLLKIAWSSPFRQIKNRLRSLGSYPVSTERTGIAVCSA